jgi:CelD/BcsL family acetyltransferase involved in cellulose biosynthesis
MHGTIDSIFQVEWRPLRELATIAAEWQSLIARALEPNVFYEPAFALAAEPVFGAGVHAGLVWSRTAPGRLMGLFPARIERHRYGPPLALMVGWTHSYAPLGTPLVDRDAAEAVIAAWFAHVAADPQLPSRMLLPYCPVEGAWARALDAAIARADSRDTLFARHRRALLKPDDRDGYLARALGRKKQKELRRQRKRLSEDGVVMSGATGDPAAVVRGLGDFLVLEASGWKGRAGTAARSQADVCAFMQQAVAALAGEGKAQVHRLFLDACAIAAMITLRSGATAWCWKVAYDENVARASPGVQLQLDVTQALLDDPQVSAADSCATANHPMIDHVWRERLELADLLIRIGPAGRATFLLVHALEALRRAAVAGAKALRDRMRR